MRREDMSREELTGDEPLAQALDRLGRLVAPESSPQTDMVARVMARIEPLAAEAPRPAGPGTMAGGQHGRTGGRSLARAGLVAVDAGPARRAGDGHDRE